MPWVAATLVADIHQPQIATAVMAQARAGLSYVLEAVVLMRYSDDREK